MGEAVANLEKALEEKQKLEVRLKDFADNDPAVMEQMVKETKEALEATNRWTDNIFSIQEWVKRKFPSIDQAGLSKQFGIPEDLDYIVNICRAVILEDLDRTHGCFHLLKISTYTERPYSSSHV